MEPFISITKQGQLHNEGDLPAFIGSNGTQEWFKDGKLHREDDKPAIIGSDGTQRWWKDGKSYDPKQTKSKPECDGKIVEIDGIKYKLHIVND